MLKAHFWGVCIAIAVLSTTTFAHAFTGQTSEVQDGVFYVRINDSRGVYVHVPQAVFAIQNVGRQLGYRIRFDATRIDTTTVQTTAVEICGHFGRAPGGYALSTRSARNHSLEFQCR